MSRSTSSTATTPAKSRTSRSALIAGDLSWVWMRFMELMMRDETGHHVACFRGHSPDARRGPPGGTVPGPVDAGTGWRRRPRAELIASGKTGAVEGGATVAQSAPSVELSVEGRDVRISNPDRVYFPDRGETKLDL